MSTWQAIAGVTIMLEHIITEGVIKELESGSLGTVTTKPLDRAREAGEENNQINIFLYQTVPNTAWRNLDMPNKVKPGETGKPPLALNLYYLITVYGEKNDEIQTHSLLGSTMRVLHDRPLITSQYIHDLIKKFGEEGQDEKKQVLVESDIENQLERISVTPTTLSLEEISKLWGTFQIQYRLSAAYEVSVVLIESKRPVKTPLPVLSRGSKDKGVDSQSGTIPPLPSIIAIKLPENEFYFTIGKDLIVEGYNLENSVEVHCQNPHTEKPIVLTPTEVTDRQITVNIDNTKQWSAGFYTVTVKVKDGNPDRETNSLTFPLVPEVKSIDYIFYGKILNLTCESPVQKGQQVALLLDSQEIPYQFPEGQEKATLLTFHLSQVIPPGDYVVRLRVDGVDSVPIDYTQQPPTFERKLKIDERIIVQTNPPEPCLTAIRLQTNQDYMTVGNNLILVGHNLKSEQGVKVECKHSSIQKLIELTPIKTTDKEIKVELNGNHQQWLSGSYTVKVSVVQGGSDKETNTRTFQLVPEVTHIDDILNNKILTLTCKPPVEVGQEVALLLGDVEISPGQFSGPESKLTFDVSNVAAGEYVVRLRVDGIHSVPIDFRKQPPQYKNDQKVKIR